MMNRMFFFLLLFSPFIANAQLDNASNYQISYYGDMMIRPGIQIGYETPIKNWTKTRKNEKRQKFKSLGFGIDLTYYFHRNHHHGLIISPNISISRTKDNGNFRKLKMAIGYHRSFTANPTFQVNDQEEIVKAKGRGQNTLYTNLSLQFGKDLRTKDIPIRYFWSLGLTGRTPYNNSFLFGTNLGMGAHFFIK